ncbi:MAG: MBL fold metallo-hydrolase [Cyanobacteria bacterium HKST-UBA03]|nr:MBL fold metallo-hydrolase [Cyanobacteria bacterium HKST-UBA03]
MAMMKGLCRADEVFRLAALPPAPLIFGDYRVTILPVGHFALDGGAMFGVVPKTLWSKRVAADEQNRIRLAQNCLLIEYGDQKLLLDSGVGGKFDEKYTALYAVEPSGGIVEALKRVNLTPEAIDTVMLTHLHFDHSGGLSAVDASGVVVPTFERARHLIHQGEWAHAHAPNLRDKASYLPQNLDPLRDLPGLELLSGDKNEVLPGLWLIRTGGHTSDHQILVLDTPQGGLIYWADIIPTRHHLGVPWVMGYDLYPVETMAVKVHWLKEAHDKGWFNVFEHDPDRAMAKLRLNEARQTYEWVEQTGELAETIEA